MTRSLIYKILFLSLFLSAALFAFSTTKAEAGICPPMCSAELGADNVSRGVFCEINEVTLFAVSAEDCKKAGGVTTHSVKAVVEPVEENKPE